ncbi:MAG: T9SS type A sorting domain-containing protein [Crocinitomicaceae bacterium]|nr:T9SS type A sorting domain-containing protein [Crocinitomicaceae bacterium]
MKWKCVVIANLLCFAAGAQITVTETDLPEAGYTYFVSADTTTAVNLGTPSAVSQSWDYSSLLLHYFKVPTYDSTINTSYAADFPASTHYTYGPAAFYSGLHGGAPVGTQGMNNGYMFWRRDITGFWIVGFRAEEGDYANKNVTLLQQELLVGCPATYNDVFNNTARWELLFDENSANADTTYVNNVEKVLTADAFGELITPTGTFSNVIRLHEYVITSDSAYAEFMSVPVYAMELNRDTLNNYIFLDNNTHYPVCVVHADKNNTVLYVEYYEGYSMTEISNVEVISQLNVFPNPSTGNFQINLEDSQIENTKLIITDLNGRVIYQSNLSENQNDISVKTSPGLYNYTVMKDNEIIATGIIQILP